MRILIAIFGLLSLVATVLVARPAKIGSEAVPLEHWRADHQPSFLSCGDSRLSSEGRSPGAAAKRGAGIRGALAAELGRRTRGAGRPAGRAARCLGGNAVPHARLGRAGERPADRIFRAPDLAGKQVRPAHRQPRRRAGRSPIHARSRRRTRPAQSVRSAGGAAAFRRAS